MWKGGFWEAKNQHFWPFWCNNNRGTPIPHLVILPVNASLLFAPPKKKNMFNWSFTASSDFSFTYRCQGNFAENLINFEATSTTSKFWRDPDSMEEHCTMAQHVSEEGLVFANSSTWIHYQAAHLQHLSFQPWCLESSRLGGYSVCTSWETPKVFN